MYPVSASALLLMLASAAFALEVALVSWRSLRIGFRALDLLGLLFVFLGVQSWLVLATGACGCLTGTWVGGVSMAGLLVMNVVPACRRRAAECLREGVFPALALVLRSAARAPVLTACGFVAFGYLVFHAVMFIAYAPPTSFDLLTYHLSKVAHWIQSGSLYLPNYPIKRAFWPSGMELLDAWWAVFLHHERFVETPGLFAHFMATGAVWAVARNLGFGRRGAGWSALLFAITPAIVAHGATAMNDLPIIAVLLYLLALWTTCVDGDDVRRRRWMLTFCAMCFGIGIKPTLVYMLPGVAIPALACIRKRDFQVLATLFRAPRLLWMFAVLAVLLGGCWYVHNAVRFGSPFYPVTTGVATAEGLQSGTLSLSSLKGGLSMLFTQKGILDGGVIIPNLWKMTGWGWFAVCCGIPGSLFFAAVSRKFRIILLAQAVAVVVVLSAVIPYSSCLRFLLWMPSVLCIGFVGTMMRVRIPRLLAALVLTLAAWTAGLSVLQGMGSAATINWTKQLTAPWRRKGVNARIQNQLLRFVPEKATVAVFSHQEGPVYLLYGPRYTRTIYTIDTTDGPVDFARILDSRRIGYLFYPGWPRPYPDAAKALEQQVEAGEFTYVGGGIFVRGKPDVGEGE